MQIDVMGIPTYYETFGDHGDPVLILHGWGMDVSSMLPVISRLKKFHRVTAVDFPAHGGTGMPKGNWGVKDFAQWTEAFIKAVGLPPCHVVAHSFGGRVAVYLAAYKPKLFRDVVLTGSAGLLKPRTFRDRYKSFRYRVNRTLLGALTHIPPVRERATKWLLAYRDKHNSADYKALAPEMRGTFTKVVRQDLSDEVKKIPHQTLLIWGEEDTETPMWAARRFHELLQHSSLVVMPGGHFACITYPDAFTDYVLDFFEEKRSV